MKKIIIILTIALMATTAFAEETMCDSLARMAKGAITARQNNVPISEVMDALPKEESRLKDFIKMVIISAYEVPLFTSEKNKLMVINEFSNTVYVGCMKGASK